MKSLHIPNRERLKGQTIICRKCGNKTCSEKKENGNVKWVCKSSGKLLKSCPNPESQKFISALYNPFNQKNDLIIRHSTRNFEEFRKKHIELQEVERKIKTLYKTGQRQQAMNMVQAFRKKPKTKLKENLTVVKQVELTKDTDLETAMIIYNKWLKGDLGEVWEKRPESEKMKDNYRRTLERFHECLTKNGHTPIAITLASLEQEHLHCWVREVKLRYQAAKTRNDYLNNLNVVLNWFKTRSGVNICNALELVRREEVQGDTTIASLSEFKQMITLITPENGKGKETWKDSKTGKMVSKSKNYYRDWLVDGMWLALLLGGRGDDLTEFKWNEIKSRENENGDLVYWIELFDYKYYKAKSKQKTRHNHIPMYNQTFEILRGLGMQDKIGTDAYVLAPDFENRARMKRILSDSFRWFWRDVAKFDEKVKYKSLRSTFITLATNLAGDQWKLIQKHTNTETTRRHYYNKSVAVGNMFGQDFYDVNVA